MAMVEERFLKLSFEVSFFVDLWFIYLHAPTILFWLDLWFIIPQSYTHQIMIFPGWRATGRSQSSALEKDQVKCFTGHGLSSI
mmetsp:Transcript_22146/g.61545  ORF Transcript_22146/g.61545 Transcript_22146/m.61545 type:complete len:83 (-) Transcript_22146:685-933(-)